MSSIIASRLPPLPVSISVTGRGRLSSLAQAHGLGKSPSGVDGEDDDLTSHFGGAKSERGRGRRLADPTRAAADDDADAAILDQPVDIEPRDVRQPRRERPHSRLIATAAGAGEDETPSRLCAARQNSPLSSRSSAKAYRAPRSTPSGRYGKVTSGTPACLQSRALFGLQA